MMDKLPVEELEAIANIEVGEALRQTRLHYGQTLEDVEKNLRIRACQISAIEQGDMNLLPGRVYAIGFVRSYAEYLGLDGARAVQLFKAQYMDTPAGSMLSFPVLASESKSPAIWLVVLSFVLAVSFFYTWHNFSIKNDSSAVLYIDPVPDRIKAHIDKNILVSLPVSENITVLDNLNDSVVVENMAKEEEQRSGIILNIIDDSWVEIKTIEGKIIVSDILEKGEQYFVPDNPNLSMSLGNAANVEIIIDARALKPLGKDGDVRRDIPLNTAYLKTLEFKEETP